MAKWSHKETIEDDTQTEPIGSSCNIHRIFRKLENQCDLSLFEIHVITKNVPDWCLEPFPNREDLDPVLFVMDFIVDNEARFIIRFIYVVPFTALDEDRSAMNKIKRKQLCDNIDNISTLGLDTLVWTRNKYLTLSLPLKDVLSSLHLYYLGYYYYAPSNGADTLYDKIQDDAKIREEIFIPSFLG